MVDFVEYLKDAYNANHGVDEVLSNAKKYTDNVFNTVQEYELRIKKMDAVLYNLLVEIDMLDSDTLYNFSDDFKQAVEAALEVVGGRDDFEDDWEIFHKPESDA